MTAKRHEARAAMAFHGGDERSRVPVMKRRDFLIAGAALGVAGLGCLGGCSSYTGTARASAGGVEGRHWGFVVDVERFNREADMGKIQAACHHAHNVPDIGDPKEEVKWIWGEPFEASFADIHSEHPSRELEEATVPVLCNHCEEPPCVRLCPTEATFKRADGIVIMDYHRCIGCRFCMAGCPYGARSLNFSDPRPYLDDPNPDYPTRSKGVVEKCMLCSERIDEGQVPLCVELSEGAIAFGDLTDPGSPVRKALAGSFSIRRRVELGTGPSVYYLMKGGEEHA